MGSTHHSQAITQWLLTAGTSQESLSHLVRALAAKLRSLGIPVDRVYLGTLVLHPQAAAYYVIHEHDTGVCRANEIPHDAYAMITARQTMHPTPMSHVLDTGTSLRASLLGPEAPEMRDLRDLKERGYTDFIGLPLTHQGRPSAGLTCSTRHPDGFSEEAVALLESIRTPLGPVAMLYVQQMLQTTLLKTYLGPDAGSRVQRGQVRRGDGQTIQAAIWFCDLRNFTRLSTEHDLHSILDLLNQTFEVVVDAIDREHGQVLKFTGDGLLAIFPVKARGKEEACEAATRAALDTQQRLSVLNQKRERRGIPTTRMGIGLHVGNILYGNIGAAGRMDFTVIGPAVNLTARIQQIDASTEHVAIVSSVFAASIESPTIPLGDYALKGVPRPISVFGLG